MHPAMWAFNMMQAKPAGTDGKTEKNGKVRAKPAAKRASKRKT